jgi:hypothetical protein
MFELGLYRMMEFLEVDGNAEVTRKLVKEYQAKSAIVMLCFYNR